MTIAVLVYATTGRPIPTNKHYDIFVEESGAIRIQTDRSENDAKDWTLALVSQMEEEPREEEPENPTEEEEVAGENSAPQRTEGNGLRYKV